MTAIYKREFRDYFRGLFGWIFTALLILTGGAISATVNILGGSTEFSYLFASLPDVLILMLPFLASRTFTKERSGKNMLWLSSLPVSRIGLVVGKYLAMLTLFLIPTAVLAVFPPLLDSFGTVAYGSAYTALLGYTLLGAALLSVCGFTASLCRNQLISVTVNILLCLLLYFAPVLATLFAGLPLIGFLVCALICIGSGIWIGIRRKSLIWGALTAGIPVALLALLYILIPAFFGSLLPDVISYASLFDRLNGFCAGHLDIPAAVCYLSVAVLFLLLTAQLRTKNMRTGGGKK